MRDKTHEGLLAVWHDVAEGSEALVTDWYNTEHHAERLSVEGFLDARRYRLASGPGRQFLSLYRTRSPAIHSSAAYRARLVSPSVRTQDIMPRYRNVTRSVFRLVGSTGAAFGGCVASLADSAAPDGKQVDEAFSALLRQLGVLRCRWLLAETGITHANASPEAALRGGADRTVAWAIVVDTNESQHAADALDFLERRLRPGELQQRAAYRMVYAAGAA